MEKLIDKVAVITGGTSGIGLASSELFVAEGARVVVGGLQDDKGLELERQHPGRVIYVRADVTQDAEVASLVDAAVRRFGRLDIMFNNAGSGGDPASMLELTDEGFDQTSVLLTRSVLSGHKYASRQMQAQGTGGSIITTASVAGLQGGWATAAYTVAKHAVIGIVRQAAAELGPLGIRSNALCPSVIMTPIMAKAFGVPIEHLEAFLAFFAERFAKLHPIGRIGWPRDVAEAACFLASDGSSFITGVALPVDGGSSAVTLGTFGTEAWTAAREFVEQIPT